MSRNSGLAIVGVPDNNTTTANHVEPEGVCLCVTKVGEKGLYSKRVDC
jgi:hypothetical protein